MKVLVLTLFLAVAVYSASGDDFICERWFLKNGLTPGTDDCEMDCGTSAVGMHSFMCPQLCGTLCKSYFNRLSVDLLTLPYTMTDQEKALTQKHPVEAVAVFYSKYVAEKAAKRIFGAIPKHNNEADAFRHYVWSGHLANYLDQQKAQLFLDAHENDPETPKEEKEMDTHNNLHGLKRGAELKRDKLFSAKAIEKVALEDLGNQKLKILRPTGRLPEWK